MWVCPKCKVVHASCGLHRTHLESNPKCMEKTLTQDDNKGWQGTVLDGPPKVRVKK